MLFRSNDGDVGPHAGDFRWIFDPRQLREADRSDVRGAIVRIARFAGIVPSKCGDGRGEGWSLWAHLHARTTCAAGSSQRPAGRLPILPCGDRRCAPIALYTLPSSERLRATSAITKIRAAIARPVTFPIPSTRKATYPITSPPMSTLRRSARRRRPRH